MSGYQELGVESPRKEAVIAHWVVSIWDDELVLEHTVVMLI